MFIMFCVCDVCVFVLSFVNLFMDFESIAYCFFYLRECRSRVCRYYFKLFVSVVSIFVFGVVNVVVVVVFGFLSSVSMMHQYLNYEHVIFRQIQICIAG